MHRTRVAASACLAKLLTTEGSWTSDKSDSISRACRESRDALVKIWKEASIEIAATSQQKDNLATVESMGAGNPALYPVPVQADKLPRPADPR